MGDAIKFRTRQVSSRGWLMLKVPIPFPFFFYPNFVGNNGRDRVQTANFWGHKGIGIAFALRGRNFSPRRREKRACRRRRRRRDSSAMIRAGRKSRRGRALVKWLTVFTYEQSHRREKLHRVAGLPASRNGRDLYVMSDTERPALRQRRLRASRVYAHVTSVTKLLINAILSRRRHCAIDLRLTTIILGAEGTLGPNTPGNPIRNFVN